MFRKLIAACFVPVLSCPIPAQQSPVAAQAPQGTLQAHTVLDGTQVKLRLSQTISSADATVGQQVPFEVLEDIKVDDVIVLPKGATAIAVVTEAQPKRRMGRGGKLNMSISYARLADGEKVALRAVKEAKGGSHTGAMTGAIVATSLIIWPAAPFFLFMHGKDITIPQGMEITAFVEGDMHLDMTKFAATQAAAVPASMTVASGSETSISVESTPGGADIQIDGAFVGNTPSTLKVVSGLHEITVTKKGFAPWTRKMNVTEGNIHLNAELDKAN
jgi:hypothetical protein